MADDDIVLGIEGDPDDESWRRAGERAGQQFGDAAGARAEKALRDRLGKSFEDIYKRTRAQTGGENLFGDTARRAEQATRAAARAVEDRTAAMRADFEALEKRAAATFEALRAAGASPDLFAVINRQLRITQSAFRDVEEDLKSGGTIGEERFERLARIIKESNATVQRETAGIQSTLRTFTTAQNNANQAAARSADRAAQERIAAAKRASSETLLVTQGEQNRLLAAEKAGQKERLVEVTEASKLRAIAEREASATRQQDIRTRSKLLVDAERASQAERVIETRTGGRLQVLAEQANSRRRIEIMRFTFRQIQAFERGIAAVFRASASIVSGLAGATAAGLSRLGNVFRRTNRDMNDGLQGALSQRERSLSRSFRQQTQSINAEIGRQQQAVDRLERNLSTGVFGALSGRSRLGSALGAGALIGGGLTGANLFSQGLDRFQSLEKANLQLERLLGSATQARALLDSLNEWAQGTPLALDLVTEISVGLISMGTAASDVLPRLEAITDAVAFTGGGADEIRRVGLAIRQVASAGRLLGQDFNQIAQALPGLNLAQLLADQLTGGDTAAFLKLREAGEISAEEFVSAFVTGVQQSDAIGGSTASLATTLAGQISNLNAAWRRLGAAIITEFEGPLRASIKRLRDNLSALAKFISGDVSDNMLVLRGAVIGLAAALGALIAARAAIETLQLLGIAARFALTPFGALIVAVGALGAAIGALRVANDNFRYITDGIRELASEQFGRGLSLLADALRRLGEFLAARVLPALQRFSETILSGVVVAVRVLIAVFRAVLIPAFEALFRFLVDTGIPAVVNLASSIQQYLIPAAIALGAAWFALNAPISTVLVTFAAIGAALYILRQNSDAVRRFTDDLASSFVNLGQRLLGVARTALTSVTAVFSALGAAIVDILSDVDYEALGLRVLGFVNTLGRLLGQAITSRFVVDAALKIGAAAAVLAGSFLAGFVEGVIRGLPGAIDELTDTIRELLSAAGGPGIFDVLFSNAFSGIATLIAGAFLASSILRSFSSAGGKVAGAFSAGFVPGIRTGFSNAFRGLEALAGPERAMRRAAARQAVAYQSEFDRILRNNRRLGTESALVASGSVSRGATDPSQQAANLRRLTAEQERYVAGTGRAIAAATLFRRTWGEALRDTGNRWQAVQDRVAQTGGWAAVGQRAGVTLVTAFSAALAGQQGGTQGLVGVVASTLGALAVGGPVAAGITAIVGGASLLYTELTKADGAAQLLLETTTKIADQIRDLAGEDLVPTLAENLLGAVETELGKVDGLEALSLLPDGFFTQAANQIKVGAFDIDQTLATLATNVGLSADEIRRILDLRDISPQAFQDILRTPELAETFNFEVGSRADVGRQALLAFVDALGEVDVTGGQVVAILGALQGQAASTAGAFELNSERARLLSESLASITPEREMRLIQNAIAGISDEALTAAGNVSALDRLVQFETVGNAVSRVTGLLDRLGVKGADVFALVEEELAGTGIKLDNELTQYVRDLINEFIEAGRAADLAAARIAGIQGYLNARAAERGGGPARDIIKIGDEADKAFDASGLLNDAISELNNQRTERLRGQIEGVRRVLESAEQAASNARDSLNDFLTGGYGDSAQAQVDALVGNVGGIGSRIEEAFLQGGIRGDAAARAAVGDFGSQVASIIDAAIAQGITSQEDLRNLFAPVFGALGEETGDGFSRILSTVDFTEGITPQAGAKIIDELNRILSGSTLETKVAGVFAADREVERIQRQLDRLEAELDVKIIFDEAQIRQALTDAGASAALADAALNSVNNLTAQQLGGLVAAVAAATAQFAPPAAAGGGGNTTVINDSRTVNVVVQGSTSATLTAAEVIARANAAIAGVVGPVPGGSGFG